jgi:hypothetical protein
MDCCAVMGRSEGNGAAVLVNSSLLAVVNSYRLLMVVDLR